MALEDSKLLRVRNGDLLSHVERSPDLAIDLINLAGQRMRWMNRPLNEQVFLSMLVRLARKILCLTWEQSGSRKVLPLSQSELAEYVCAKRETVSKTLFTWPNRVSSSRHVAVLSSKIAPP